MANDNVSVSFPKYSASFALNIKGKNPQNYLFQGEVPERLMDDFKNIIGDGNAKVNVSVDMGIKDFGTGASAMCSVSLTCNQDYETIQKAISLASAVAKDSALQQRDLAQSELDNVIRASGKSPVNGRPNY